MIDEQKFFEPPDTPKPDWTKCFISPEGLVFITEADYLRWLIQKETPTEITMCFVNGWIAQDALIIKNDSLCLLTGNVICGVSAVDTIIGQVNIFGIPKQNVTVSNEDITIMIYVTGDIVLKHINTVQGGKASLNGLYWEV